LIDSCPFGLGGYSDTGFAWHFKIPKDLHYWASNNLLEYVLSFFSPRADMLVGHFKCSDCALSMTDCSTSVGWLCKTSFQEIIGKDTDPVQVNGCIKMAQHHATLFLTAGIKEYSQWFPG
jgi:hypothetical protein